MIAVLFAGESNPRAMDRVATNHLQNFGIFLAGRAEGASSRLNIVEKIFNLDHVRNIQFSKQFMINVH